MADKELDGWHVLVTRPASRANKLAELLGQEGAIPWLCPVLAIVPVGNGQLIREALARADLAIFVSVHAVDAVAGVIAGTETNPGFHLPPDLQFAAVGASTARALEIRGFSVSFQPSHQAGSEGLVESFSGIDPRGMGIEIFSAETGRPLLARFFADRGGWVNQVTCYRRQPNRDLDLSKLDDFLGVRDRLISITSVESARALLDLAGPSRQKALLRCALVVISERVAAACVDMGFAATIRVAGEASDQGMTDAALAVARKSGGSEKCG